MDNKIKKIIWFILIGTLSSFTSPANSAVIKTCTKKQIGTVKNGFVCKKNGILNVWQPITQPVNTINKVAVETNTVEVKTLAPVPVPEIKVLEPLKVNSFNDLSLNSESVQYWAWKNAQLNSSIITNNLPEVQLVIGPNTTLPNNMVDAVVKNTYTLFDNVNLPRKIILIYYSYEDSSWAQDQFFKYKRNANSFEATRMCSSKTTCWGAQAELGRQNEGIVQIAVMPPSQADVNHTSGMLEAHEIFHTLQSFQFVGTVKEQNSYCCTKTYMPWWMVEGSSEYAKNIIINNNSFEGYKFARFDILNSVRNLSLEKRTYGWISQYISAYANPEWSKQENEGAMYGIGFLVNEAIGSIYGPKANLKIFSSVANGLSFEQAFSKEFGQDFSTVQPLLANYVLQNLP